MNKKILNYVDVEIKAKGAGFRNFRSFVGLYYYGQRISLKRCGEIIGVSASKVKSSLLKRGFELRQAGRLPGKSFRKTKTVNVGSRVRMNTSFNSPEEAFHVLYEEYFLTTYEVGKVLEISQTFVCKLLRKYKIQVRKQGTRKLRRS